MQKLLRIANNKPRIFVQVKRKKSPRRKCWGRKRVHARGEEDAW